MTDTATMTRAPAAPASSATSFGHDVLGVAQHVLDVCNGGLAPSVTPMQILKLVYICHGWTLGLLGRPLVSEPVQAWRYGPVFPTLYHAVKEFRSAPIRHVPGAHPVNLDEDEKDIIQQVCTIYGKRTGMELSRLTHKADTPWSVTWHQCRGRFHTEISADLIEDYYRQLATQG